VLPSPFYASLSHSPCFHHLTCCQLSPHNKLKHPNEMKLETAAQKAKEVSGMSASEVKGKAAEVKGEAKGKAEELKGEAKAAANKGKI
jgi:hypothetical protein